MKKSLLIICTNKPQVTAVMLALQEKGVKYTSAIRGDEVYIVTEQIGLLRANFVRNKLDYVREMYQAQFEVLTLA